jgi:hypothetical protein
MKEKFAFPQKEGVGEVYASTNGLTKKEFFASMALSGMIEGADHIASPDYELYAARAVKFANALIDALENGT